MLTVVLVFANKEITRCLIFVLFFGVCGDTYFFNINVAAPQKMEVRKRKVWFFEEDCLLQCEKILLEELK